MAINAPPAISPNPSPHINIVARDDRHHLVAAYKSPAPKPAISTTTNSTLSIARPVLDDDKVPPIRNSASQAVSIFTEMLEAGLRPDQIALGSLLKASSSTSVADVGIVGQQIHAWAVCSGYASSPRVRTSLITMYGKSELLEDARRVFDESRPTHEGDVPTWNSMISAYVLNKRFAECFPLFLGMLRTAQLIPTDHTYASLLSACASTGRIQYGRVLHGRMIITDDELVDKTRMYNSLISLYTKSGDLECANRLFESMNCKNIVSWNAMIAGHAQNGECENAVRLFRRMLRSDRDQVSLKPNRITFLSVLSALSAAMLGLKLGREIHAKLIRLGLETSTSIGNSLITMYGKFSEVVKARRVFEMLPFRDVVTWNSMLKGYAQERQMNNCCKLYEEMRSSGSNPDNHTLTTLLSAVSSDSSLSGSQSQRLGREIHGYILRRFEQKSGHISAYNAILAMYAKANRIGDAEKIFEGMMNERDSYSWNAMMDGYSAAGHYSKAFILFFDMLEKHLQPDHLAISILLTACGKLVSIQLGDQLHAFTIKSYLHHDYALHPALLSVHNALVSMYSKCGDMGDAARVFVLMKRRDVFSWTAMITGYARHGMATESLRLFEEMKRDGFKPNSVTYLGLITACAHAGLVEEGAHYFSSMSKDSSIKPSIEHYACMVDLFGRSGQFERALDLIETAISPLGPNRGPCVCLWKVLLGACHAHKQLELGVHAATRILELEPDDETTHILLSNLYAGFGLWENAIAVRRSMKDMGLKKEIGCSWIELGYKRHVFVAGDSFHPSRKEIYEKLKELYEKYRCMGYVPMTQYVLHDVETSQKEEILGSHSEKLAVSFALLQTMKTKTVIRVFKNLRVCGDCHNWMKIASQVEGREIVLRDSCRFHLFNGGTCSCGDYW